ncbi:hypothetical protein M885DRAFT_210440 [Pelagophyceae sp. CCMP2097]|nr:hypothetical protein M885DRAFT_210440 [Pelagophyceae sp. CCMP2097]
MRGSAPFWRTGVRGLWRPRTLASKGCFGLDASRRALDRAASTSDADEETKFEAGEELRATETAKRAEGATLEAARCAQLATLEAARRALLATLEAARLAEVATLEAKRLADIATLEASIEAKRHAELATLEATRLADVATLEAKRLADLATLRASIQAKRHAEVATLEAKRVAELATLEAKRLADLATLEASIEAKRHAEVATLEARRIADLAALEASIEATRVADLATLEAKRLADLATLEASIEAKREAEVAMLEAKRHAEVATLEAKRLADLATLEASIEAKRLAEVATLEAKRVSDLATLEASIEAKRLAEVATLEAKRLADLATLEAKRLADIATLEAMRLADLATLEARLAERRISESYESHELKNRLIAMDELCSTDGAVPVATVRALIAEGLETIATRSIVLQLASDAYRPQPEAVDVEELVSLRLRRYRGASRDASKDLIKTRDASKAVGSMLVRSQDCSSSSLDEREERVSPAPMPATVLRLDRLLLVIILDSLLSNAFKYGDAGVMPCVEVHVSKTKGQGGEDGAVDARIEIRNAGGPGHAALVKLGEKALNVRLASEAESAKGQQHIRGCSTGDSSRAASQAANRDSNAHPSRRGPKTRTKDPSRERAFWKGPFGKGLLERAFWKGPFGKGPLKGPGGGVGARAVECRRERPGDAPGTVRRRCASAQGLVAMPEFVDFRFATARACARLLGGSLRLELSPRAVVATLALSGVCRAKVGEASSLNDRNAQVINALTTAIVDDSRINCRMLERVARKAFPSASAPLVAGATLASIEDFARRVVDADSDVVLVDQNFGAVCQSLYGTDLVSANHAPNDLATYVASGADGHIPKNVTVEKLRQIISESAACALNAVQDRQLPPFPAHF